MRWKTPTPLGRSSMNWQTSFSPLLSSRDPNPCFLPSLKSPSQVSHWSWSKEKFLQSKDDLSYLILSFLNTPKPWYLLSRNWPSKILLPYLEQSVPFPSRMLLLQKPRQKLPSGHSIWPQPSLLPFWISPRYLPPSMASSPLYLFSATSLQLRSMQIPMSVWLSLCRTVCCCMSERCVGKLLWYSLASFTRDWNLFCARFWESTLQRNSTGLLWWNTRLLRISFIRWLSSMKSGCSLIMNESIPISFFEYLISLKIASSFASLKQSSYKSSSLCASSIPSASCSTHIASAKASWWIENSGFGFCVFKLWYSRGLRQQISPLGRMSWLMPEFCLSRVWYIAFSFLSYCSLQHGELSNSCEYSKCDRVTLPWWIPLSCSVQSASTMLSRITHSSSSQKCFFSFCSCSRSEWMWSQTRQIRNVALHRHRNFLLWITSIFILNHTSLQWMFTRCGLLKWYFRIWYCFSVVSQLLQSVRVCTFISSLKFGFTLFCSRQISPWYGSTVCIASKQFAIWGSIGSSSDCFAGIQSSSSCSFAISFSFSYFSFSIISYSRRLCSSNISCYLCYCISFSRYYCISKYCCQYSLIYCYYYQQSIIYYYCYYY